MAISPSPKRRKMMTTGPTIAQKGDNADVFRIKDLWGGSEWLEGETKEREGGEGSGYFGGFSDFSLKEPVVNTTIETSPFFQLPQIDSDTPLSTLPLPHLNSSPPTSTPALEPSTEPPQEDEEDLWLETVLPPIEPPKYRTWSAFYSLEELPPPEACLVTETSPGTWDIILRSRVSEGQDDPVGDMRTYLRCLLSALVGRDSVFFQWDAKAKTMKTAIENLRVSGYSRDVLKKLENKCLNCGVLFRRLNKFVKGTYTQSTAPRTRVALSAAVETILGIVEEHVALSNPPETLLQLNILVSRVLGIITESHELVKNDKSSYMDEDILQFVFSHAEASEFTSSSIHTIMKILLQRVSHPWVSFLSEWVGLSPESGIPLSLEAPGVGKHFVKVESELYIDDFGEEAEQVDYRLDRTKMPGFVPGDVAEALFEIGRNLRFIRREHPGHPLGGTDVVKKAGATELKWEFDWGGVFEGEKRAEAYKKRLTEVLKEEERQRRRKNLQRVVSMVEDENEKKVTEGWGLQIFGFKELEIDRHLESSRAALSQPPPAPPEDPLTTTVKAHLSSPSSFDASQPQPVTLSPHWSLLPLLSLTPLPLAHGHHINRTVLSLLFTPHDLPGHLVLHHSFSLFGSGAFSSRLTQALFDSSLDTTELSGGWKGSSSGVLGLRIGRRDKWPPASSELRLALGGILKEAYAIDGGKGDVPGDLSFAVRALSNADIEKCMDPDGLEAMDFLRLSYRPPAALSSIFDPVILMQYDRIFKWLLRVARLTYVVDGLSRRAITERDPEVRDIIKRFAFEAHRFVYAIGLYFRDCAVSMIWGGFMRWIRKVQRDLQDDVDSPWTPEHLRTAHSITLKRLLTTLFLRKRQAAISKVADDIFSAILRFDAVVRVSGHYENAEQMDRLYREFKEGIDVFMGICRAVVEKGDAGGGKERVEVLGELGGWGEANVVGMLVVRLGG